MASQAVSVVCVGMAGKNRLLSRVVHSVVETDTFLHRLRKDHFHAKNQLAPSLEEDSPLRDEPRPGGALSSLRK
jgi:hypothetical protein